MTPTQPIDKFKFKWMFADSRSQGRNWKMIAALIQKFIESGALKLDVEFTAPDIDGLKKALDVQRKALESYAMITVEESELWRYSNSDDVKLAREALAEVDRILHKS